MPTERRTYLIMCLAKALGWDQIGVSGTEAPLASHVHTLAALDSTDEVRQKSTFEKLRVTILTDALEHLDDDRLGELVDLAERGKLDGLDRAIIKLVASAIELA